MSNDNNHDPKPGGESREDAASVRRQHDHRRKFRFGLCFGRDGVGGSGNGDSDCPQLSGGGRAGECE